MVVGSSSIPPSKFRDRVKLEREQEILKAAQDVFFEKGFERTSIDDIAERVGIGKGTVYLHFTSKEEILLAIMRVGAEGIVNRCHEAASSRNGAIEKLGAILDVLVEHRFANQRLMAIVSAALPDFLGRKEKTGAGDSIRLMVAELVAQGQTEGVISNRANPRTAANALLTLVFVCPVSEDTRQLSRQEVRDAASQLFFHGITEETKQ
ncbi:MAG: TetR/AcrR family transcriptional regulator [Chloroflexi bacterium]|nr:TetR/AcrR family transcriptional regulator [Chloroflexota bacterium]